MPRLFACFLLSFALVLIAASHPVTAQDTVAPLPAPATQQPTAEDAQKAELRKQIQKYYDQMNEGLSRLDINAFVQYYALDYRALDKNDEKQTLKQYKDAYRFIFRRAMGIKATTVMSVFEPKSDTITVETRKEFAFRGRSDGGVDLYIEGMTQDRDFWMKRKGKWLIKQSRVYDFSMKVNGQTVKD